MSGRCLPLLSLLALVLAGSGCVRFQPAALYAGVEPAPAPERPRSLALAVEPVIYRDAADDTIWFDDKPQCTQGGLTTDVVFEGERAVAVSWNRGAEGCAWAGFGIGWDQWRGKDLSAIWPHAAIEMRVRTREGRMYGLPIVLTLEDYSGGMGFAYVGTSSERAVIDEQWQRVTVPLANFETEIERLDRTNVKQLMFELQQSGSIYVDAVRLVWAEPDETEPWFVEPERPDPTALPITLFDDAFVNDDGWGIVTDACQDVRLSDAAPAAGALAIHARWDMAPERCRQGTLGVSWDRWFPVDLMPVAGAAAIELRLRLPAGEAAAVPVQIGVEDYSRRLSVVGLSAAFAEGDRLTDRWQRLTIPLSALRGDADLANVKQLVVRLDGAGEVFLDEIRLVRLTP